MGELSGKSVLITGGARRLGRAIALAMARAGAHVAITYRTSERDARRTAAAIRRAGVKGLALPCDVRDPASVSGAVREAVRRLRRLDVLVNNAAVYETVAFERIAVEQWDRMFESNVRGPYLVTQAALPALRRARGRIINMGSLGGLHPWTGHAHYCASKAALAMLSQVMAKALAPEIAVNCIAPGMIDLEAESSQAGRQAARQAAAFFRRMAARTPMQRNGEAADVVAAAMFFAAAPHFITGQMLVIDGGLGL